MTVDPTSLWVTCYARGCAGRPPTLLIRCSGYLLRARMRGAVAGFQAFGGDVSVDLGRAQARVPKKLLHCTEVSTTVKQVCRGRVAKRVWAIRPGSGQVSEQGCYKTVDRAGANAPTASTEKGGGLETSRRSRMCAGFVRWASG